MAETAPSGSMAIGEWLESFALSLQRQDLDAVLNLFNEEECFWRDLVAFTWNIYTAESRDDIKDMLLHTLPNAMPQGWSIERELPQEMPGVLHAFLRFETKNGRCRGHIRLKDGKCWTLLTAMEELKGFEEKAGPRRERGVEHGAFKDRKTWLDERREEIESLGMSREKQPFCLIVGGGLSGVSLGARLRRLQVPTIIVEKTAKPGDVWRNRYKSLHLHDSVGYHHFPYIPLPDHWPVYCSKDQLADWIEAYTQVMELVYWSSTECKSARYVGDPDGPDGTWEVEVEKEGKTCILYPKELVIATGLFGKPYVPKFDGMEEFEGVQLHSSQYQSGEPWKGKKCVVVGSNTSAHDICSDLWEHDAAQVTMVQRSPTLVVRFDTFQTCSSSYYSEGSPFSTIDADFLFSSIPLKLIPSFHIPLTKEIARVDASLYEGLKSCGFLLDFGEDGSGFFLMALRRGSGYYIDVGTSQLLIDNEVKLKSGVGVKKLKANSVVLTDGSELEADLIVYATGYTPMSQMVAKLISQEVANKVGKCWGVGSGTKYDPGPWEREIRNVWKPTQQPHLWIIGGNILLARINSLYLALQIKARLEGIVTPVYGLATVHHNE